jgi:hypothetical protein
MKTSVCMLVILPVLFSMSCSKELETAAWKEIPVVYAIINIKDTAQYVRINRVFTSDGDPCVYTMTDDSVNYHDNAFDVTLQEYRNGLPVADPLPYIPVSREKEPGLFSNHSNCVYKINVPLNKGSEYLLRLVNRETGAEAWSRNMVFGQIGIQEAFYRERAFYRVNYVAEPMPGFGGSLAPDDHEYYIVRFLYWEYAGSETFYKYVDWVPAMDPLKELAEDDTTCQLFDAYYKYLSEQIPIDPSVKRRARGVDYMLALPGHELETFMLVYEQTTNPHFFPDYTNINDGFGIFGCKYYYTYFGLKFRKSTIDTISRGRYLVNHRFADSNGEWH